MFSAGDSLRRFEKVIPDSLLGTDLNKVGCGFCAKAGNETKNNRCGYNKIFFIMADKR